MLADLSLRQVAPEIAQALIEYINESIKLNPEKPNIIRVINNLLKGFRG
jgi:hypothetical protein